MLNWDGDVGSNPDALMIKLQNKEAGGKECCEADIDMSQLYQNRDQN